MKSGVIGLSTFLEGLNYLENEGKNGDLIRNESNGLTIARKLDDTIMIDCKDVYSNTTVEIVRPHISLIAVELGDLLYLECGAILRAIKCKEHNGIKRKYDFDLEIVNGGRLNTEFIPSAVCWQKNGSYGVNSYLDVVKISKTDGTTYETAMYNKHIANTINTGDSVELYCEVDDCPTGLLDYLNNDEILQVYDIHTEFNKCLVVGESEVPFSVPLHLLRRVKKDK